MSCHESAPQVDLEGRHFALLGSPNAGKTTLFNALTGLHARTGNYPGVTVAMRQGRASLPAGTAIVEDLPGTYSLEPISPDEQVVVDVLAGRDGLTRPTALLMVLDATSLRRSLGLLAQALHTELPLCVVLSFTDELARRGGSLDVDALSRALGLRVVVQVAGDRHGIERIRQAMSECESWPTPPVLPPTTPEELPSWISSVLEAARHRPADVDGRTQRIDAVLLHPLWGTVVFLATMFTFFQTIFTVAAPMQGLVERGFSALGHLAANHISIGWLSRFVSEALIGGVGGVVVFLPQILLLFLMLSLLEGVGYLSRAAFLMDRLMAKAGLEGRAFVALLSSVACAIPGIMATRTLPSARDRIATMLAAPLMTCSARLPVYVLLISLLVPAQARVFGLPAQGTVMFGLYLFGAVAAMTTAWLVKKVTGRGELMLPFYLEMPTYQLPRPKVVAHSAWEACAAFLRKVTTIILVTTALLWVLLSFPAQAYRDGPEHSYAASVGRAIEPIFAPLGFDWRINIGVISSMAARETFVATLGQVAAAEDPEHPARALAQMRVSDPDGSSRRLFDGPTTAALLVYFALALQCVSTIGVMRREAGGWRWPGIAFAYMFALAWLGGLLAHTLVQVWW